MLVLAFLIAASWVTDAVAGGGYPALAGLLLLENLFPPIPSEAILPLAGYSVGRGTLQFVPALIASTAGSVVGAAILYALGRYGGRPLLERWGRIVRLDRRALDRADAWLDRRGPLIVLLGRLVPGVRSLVSIPAGWARMPLPLFFVLTTLGSAAWNAILIGAGVALGRNWTQVETVVAPISKVVVVLVALALVAALAAHVLRRRRVAS